MDFFPIAGKIESQFFLIKSVIGLLSALLMMRIIVDFRYKNNGIQVKKSLFFKFS